MNHRRSRWDDASEGALNTQASLGDAQDNLSVFPQLDARMDAYQSTAYRLISQIAISTTDPNARAKAKGALIELSKAERIETYSEKRVTKGTLSVKSARSSNSLVLTITEQERKAQ